MSRRADPLRELARLARIGDPGSHTIGPHILRHAPELAQALGVPEPDLTAAAAEPDDVLAPKVRATLRTLHEARLANQEARHGARALEAARSLKRGAQWQDGAVVLDAALVLGDLLADQRRPHILFALHDGTEVVVERRDLVATARTIGRRPDLVTFVDPAGVHVRWNGGRGGLNWYPRFVSMPERERALLVDLPGPALVPTPSSRRTRSRTWAWDVLSELGLAP